MIGEDDKNTTDGVDSMVSNVTFNQSVFKVYNLHGWVSGNQIV